MPVNDVYQVVDTQSLLGQKCLNVYFFKMEHPVTAEDKAFDVADGFVTNFLPLVIPVQSTGVIHESVLVRNLYDVSDTYEQLISVQGTGEGGDNLGAFAAYGIKLVGDNGAVRPGLKRIAGVPEAVAVDGVVTDSTALAALTTLAAGMAAAVLFGEGGAGALVPVIVGRILDGLDYRLPANTGEAVLSLVTDTLFQALVTSQVSRKVGNGE